MDADYNIGGYKSMNMGKIYLPSVKPYKIGEKDKLKVYTYIRGSGFGTANDLPNLPCVITIGEVYATVGSPYNYKEYTDIPINGCSRDNLESPIVNGFGITVNGSGGGAIIISNKPQFLTKGSFLKNALVISGNNGEPNNSTIADAIRYNAPCVVTVKNNSIDVITDGKVVEYKNSFNTKDELEAYCKTIGVDTNRIMWNNMGGAWDCKYMQVDANTLKDADAVYFVVEYKDTLNSSTSGTTELEIDENDYYELLMWIMGEIEDVNNTCCLVELPDYVVDYPKKEPRLEIHGAIL